MQGVKEHVMAKQHFISMFISLTFCTVFTWAGWNIEVPAGPLSSPTKEYEYSVTFPDGQTRPVYQADSHWPASKLHLMTPQRFEAAGPMKMPGYTLLTVKNNQIIHKEKDVLSNGVPVGCYVVFGRSTVGEYLNKFQVGGRMTVAHDKPFPQLSFKIKVDARNEMRNTNMLIAYDGDWGNSTRSNIWGMEVILRGGKVIDVCYAPDSPILDGDMVLSGAGQGRWLLDSGIFPGMTFKGKGDVITFSADVQSYVDYCQWYLDKVANLLKTPEAKDFNPNAAKWASESQQMLDQTKALIKDKKVADAWKQWKEAFELAKKAYYGCSVSLGPDGVRGLWVERPPADNDKGKQLCWLLSQGVFNWVILPLEPNSNDESVKAVMKDFVEFCHSHGIKVSLWTWLPTRLFTPDPTVKQPFKAIDVQDKSEITATVKNCIKFVKELNADGVTFDFEGYTPDSKKMLYSFLKTLPPSQRGAALKEIETKDVGPFKSTSWAWARYQERILRKAVEKMCRELKKFKPDIKLSVCPEAGDTGVLKPVGMLWTQWVNDGYFDEYTPQHYHSTPAGIENRARILERYVTRDVPQVASIIAYNDSSPCGSYGFEPRHLIESIRAAQCGGCKGVYFFASNWIQWGKTIELVEALKVGPFRTEETPTKSESSKKSNN